MDSTFRLNIPTAVPGCVGCGSTGGASACQYHTTVGRASVTICDYDFDRWLDSQPYANLIRNSPGLMDHLQIAFAAGRKSVSYAGQVDVKHVGGRISK